MDKGKRVLIILVFILFLIIIGMAFAIFREELRGKNENKTIIPTIKVVYQEPDYSISSTKMSDDVGKTQDNYYEFSVEAITDGDVKLKYYIFAEESPDNNITSENIKVYLTDADNKPVGRFKDNTTSLYLNSLDNNSEKLKNVIDSQCIKFKNNFVTDCSSNKSLSSKSEYRLRFWIADSFEGSTSVTDNNTTHIVISNSYIYKFKINVLVAQQ